METALHPRSLAEKASAAHLDIVCVNYGPSTELVWFIARKGKPQTSNRLRGLYEPRSGKGIGLR